ncbi:MAG: hypothetical protein KDC34_13315 [Saprospiraceae bacterium]|nr:hypothetical protein [Saprospiraceae bacterium]
MKLIRLFGVAVVLSSVFASCAPKYGCYGMTDATMESGTTQVSVVALDVCP